MILFNDLYKFFAEKFVFGRSELELLLLTELVIVWFCFIERICTMGLVLQCCDLETKPVSCFKIISLHFQSPQL
jgi:hypothetical protein